MKNTNLSAIKGAIIAVAIATAFLNVTASAQGDPPDRSLEGVWMVSITPRNCDTGDPIPVAMPLRQIWTFHGDKTILSSFGTNVLALSRTAAHGVWERRQGWSEYAYKFVHLRQNSTTLEFRGKQESAGRLSLGANGDEFSSSGSTIVFSIDDIPGAPSCSSATGTRFKVDQ